MSGGGGGGIGGGGNEGEVDRVPDEEVLRGNLN